MFTHDRIIFTLDHFFGHCPGIFLGHIEVTRSGCGIQADFNSSWFRHGYTPF